MEILDFTVLSRYSPNALTTMFGVFESDTVTGLPTITHLMQSGANPTELARLCHRTRSGCLVMGASRLASVLFDIEKSPGSNEKSPNAEELEDAAKETIAALREYLDIQGK